MASSGSRAMWLLVYALAVCEAVSARSLLQTSPVSVVVDDFKKITGMSVALKIETQKVNLINAPSIGYKIAQGFGSIISEVVFITSKIQPDSMKPFGDDDARTVVAELTKFVQVHKELLNVVIGKHGLLTLFPFFEPIRQSLVSLEAAVDALAYSLIALIPTQKSEAQEQFGSLGITVQLAISTYDQPLLRSSLER